MKPLLLLLAVLLMPAPLTAADLALDNQWQINPYRARRADYTSFPLLSWQGEYLYIDGDEAGLLAWQDNNNTLKLKGWWFDRHYDRRDGADASMRQLNNRRTTLMAALSYQRITPYGALFAQLATDALGQSNGMVATLSWTGYRKTGALEWFPAVGIDWEDARQTRYYYGITDDEAHRSGLTGYRPGAALTPWLQMAWQYRFNARWQGFIAGRVNWLDQDVRRSPMVEKPVSYTFDIGVNVHF
ncbi:MipA/OmpV family protein [Erwinia sp. V71]|uniref:MipA/OmpV family protein n=1 Tax=Erwinia sp. V71 TaxID=3369424 RepID=UPI003F5FC9E2